MEVIAEQPSESKLSVSEEDEYEYYTNTEESKNDVSINEV